jgi:hypothetical protein
MVEDYDSSDTVVALVSAGVDVSRLLDVTARRVVTGDDAVTIITDSLNKVNAAVEAIYQSQVSPLVFFIGATGLVPDELGATALTAEQFTETYPGTTLSKAEKEASFFVLGSHVLTVYVKGEHFTVTRAAA